MLLVLIEDKIEKKFKKTKVVPGTKYGVFWYLKNGLVTFMSYQFFKTKIVPGTKYEVFRVNLKK
jgi:hypothetical protein